MGCFQMKTFGISTVGALLACSYSNFIMWSYCRIYEYYTRQHLRERIDWEMTGSCVY